MELYPLTISKVQHETNEALSIYFSVPEDIKEKFRYLPGQYLTLTDVVKDKEVRRPYSICTAPHSGELAVTVKKLKGGLFSEWVHKSWREGMVKEIGTPEGNFTLKCDQDAKRKHVFIAAGSGITPIVSMIAELLESEPMSNCYLLYGSRDEEHIIFKNQIDLLTSRYENQFFVHYTLSKPLKEKAGGLSGLFKKSSIRWTGDTGRIDKTKLTQFFDEYKVTGPETIYYICGPGDMINMVESTLINDGVDTKKILKEFFAPAGTVSAQPGTGGKVLVILQGKTIEYRSDGKKTILEELVNLGEKPPYSCTSGACSTCMAKVNKGKVSMDVCYALDDEEVRAGYILTCQAHVTSDELELSFDL